MIKKITLGLCLAGALATSASAAGVSDSFYGFGQEMKGSYNGINYVGFGKIDVSYDAEEIGDEWTWNVQTLFGCNFNSAFYSQIINSGWIYGGKLYASRYRNSSDINNEIIEMDAEGNLVNTISVGYSRYGMILKALLNPEDNMLYCFTTDFSGSVYFGKVSPDKVSDFESEFQQLYNFGYEDTTVPIAAALKGNEVYFLNNQLGLSTISLEGNVRQIGKLGNVSTDFKPSEWTAANGKDRGGIGMFYSESLGKFLLSVPLGLDGSHATSRAYAFSVDTDAYSIPCSTVAIRNTCGEQGESFWNTFFPISEIKNVELGTPKAPAEVIISATDDEGYYKISWTPVTECVEEGTALDTPNLTYRVLLNDEVVVEASTSTYEIVEIPAGNEPKEYTAHVWAVCPNATSAEATSNTITVSPIVGVSGLAAEKSADRIYTVLGTRVDVASASELPAGLYIINGKKVVVK